MLDLLIVLGFIAYAIYSGFKSKNDAGKNLTEYFLAGRSIKGWRAGLSMAATQFAADTPLLVTGMIATGGIFLVWRLWIFGIAFLVMGIVLGAQWRRSSVITDAQLADLRYSGKYVSLLRGLKAIYYGTVINCTVMAMVLVAAMRIAEAFLFWDQWLPVSIYEPIYNLIESTGLTVIGGDATVDPVITTTNNLISIFLILGFTTMYSTTGGLRSVIDTDVTQFYFAMAGTLIYAGYILWYAGGISGIIEKVELIYGDVKTGELLSFVPNTEDAIMPFIVLLSLQWLFQKNSDGTGYLAQRMIACKSDKDARVAAIIFTWVQVLLRSIIWLVIGVGLLVIYPYDAADTAEVGFTAARELTFVSGIKDMLPMGIKGIMLTGLLGALASTIDTHLNWGSSYWSNDIYDHIICEKWLKRPTKSSELVWVARLSNFLILFIALAIMFNLGSIQEAWYIALVFEAGIGAVLLMRWMWERTNLFSEISAIVASLVIAPFVLAYVEESWIQFCIMAFGSTVVVIIVTLLTPETSTEKLQSFYKLTKPSGFWRKTAAAVGESPNEPLIRFRTDMIQVIVSAVSLFSLLVGFGKMMFRPSSESIMFPILLVILGLALVPVWYKGVFGKNSTLNTTKHYSDI